MKRMMTKNEYLHHADLVLIIYVDHPEHNARWRPPKSLAMVKTQ